MLNVICMHWDFVRCQEAGPLHCGPPTAADVRRNVPKDEVDDTRHAGLRQYLIGIQDRRTELDYFSGPTDKDFILPVIGQNRTGQTKETAADIVVTGAADDPHGDTIITSWVERACVRDREGGMGIVMRADQDRVDAGVGEDVGDLGGCVGAGELAGQAAAAGSRTSAKARISTLASCWLRRAWPRPLPPQPMSASRTIELMVISPLPVARAGP
ncbi:MAG TPA: hypothetical protein VGP33_17310 [Chloroflexota bacterium]|nr:hypothetical protein [Chloroflexota bacterium]